MNVLFALTHLRWEECVLVVKVKLIIEILLGFVVSNYLNILCKNLKFRIVDFSSIETAEDKDDLKVMDKGKRCLDNKDCPEGEICYPTPINYGRCEPPRKDSKTFEEGI